MDKYCHISTHVVPKFSDKNRLHFVIRSTALLIFHNTRLRMSWLLMNVRLGTGSGTEGGTIQVHRDSNRSPSEYKSTA
jgi:hypothetical protein